MEKDKLDYFKDELIQATENLYSFCMVMEGCKKLCNKAVVAMYYTVFHLETALLNSVGYEAKSHDGALTLFSKNFVLTGVFDKSASKTISNLLSARQTADYGHYVRHDVEDVIKFSGELSLFLDRFIMVVNKMDDTILSGNEFLDAVELFKKVSSDLDTDPGSRLC